jgi:hypothetical protein
MRITLTDAHAAELRAAVRLEVRARQVHDLAVLRARLPLLEATAAKNALIDALAVVYGFDPDRPFQYDPIAGELTQDDGGTDDAADRDGPSVRGDRGGRVATWPPATAGSDRG